MWVPPSCGPHHRRGTRRCSGTRLSSEKPPFTEDPHTVWPYKSWHVVQNPLFTQNIPNKQGPSVDTKWSGFLFFWIVSTVICDSIGLTCGLRTLCHPWFFYQCKEIIEKNAAICCKCSIKIIFETICAASLNLFFKICVIFLITPPLCFMAKRTLLSTVENLDHNWPNLPQNEKRWSIDEDFEGKLQ